MYKEKIEDVECFDKFKEKYAKNSFTLVYEQITKDKILYLKFLIKS